MESYFDLIQIRESCRSYADRPVGREKITACLEAARLSPSACNSQPWHYTVTDDPELRKQIAPRFGSFGLNRFADQVPAFAVVTEEKAQLMARIGEQRDSQTYAQLDIGLSVAHFVLAAAELGLGTCILGMFDEAKLKAVLGIPDESKVRLVLCIGYPANGTPRQKVRKPLDEIVSWVGDQGEMLKKTETAENSQEMQKVPPVEYLDILNESGKKVGTAPREEAHRSGLIHRVSHCWVVSPREDGVWVWFQQRAHDKQEFPDYYDIAMGGHVGAGEEPADAAVREIREEIGLKVGFDELIYLGAFRDFIRFPGFDDRELAEVFLYLHPDPQFEIGPEVERMIRLSLKELLRKERGETDRVTAYTLAGEPLVIPVTEWCRHTGEVEHFLLPALDVLLGNK